MNKLGLCVRYNCNNYGSMLQILATQKIIKHMGWDYEIIRYNKKTIPFLIKNVSRIFNTYFMRGKIMALHKRKRLKSYPYIQEKNNKRLKLFSSYREKYIGPYSPIYKGYHNLVKGSNNYDAIMVGSDQLWTPAGIKSKFYNLIFVPDHIRKISFATSFGVGKIPKNQISMTTYYLKRINYLSVRETTGAEIVKRLTGKKATVALDPTLLLTADEWQKIFPKKILSDAPYIFAYFLGTNSKYRKAVTMLGKISGLKIITCPHMDEFAEADLNFGSEQRYEVSPIDFLNLIRGAEYVCTDSFHGSVFSILNHKQFITFNRFDNNEKQSRNSRIQSLFSQLGLENRLYIYTGTELKSLLDQKIDYNAVEKKLSRLREKSYIFLENALNSKNKER